MASWSVQFITTTTEFLVILVLFLIHILYKVIEYINLRLYNKPLLFQIEKNLSLIPFQFLSSSKDYFLVCV